METVRISVLIFAILEVSTRLKRKKKIVNYLSKSQTARPTPG